MALKNFFTMAGVLLLSGTALLDATSTQLYDPKDQSQIPRTILRSRQGPLNFPQEAELLIQPARLVKVIGQRFETESWYTNPTTDLEFAEIGTALESGPFLVFLETGGQTGLDFNSSNWRFAPNTPENLTLNMLQTLLEANQDRGRHLVSFNKFLREINSEDSVVAFPSPSSIAVFPAAFVSNSAFMLNVSLPYSGPSIAFGRIYPFNLDPAFPTSWTDVSADYDTVVHELFHVYQGLDQPNYPFFPNNPIYRGYMEGKSEIQCFYLALSNSTLQKLLAIESNGNLTPLNFTTLSSELVSSYPDKLNPVLDQLKNHFAISRSTDILPNGYTGTGIDMSERNTIYRIGHVFTAITISVYEYIVNLQWQKVPKDLPLDEQIEEYVSILDSTLSIIKQLDYGARILKAEATLSHHFSLMYFYLPDMLRLKLDFSRRDIQNVLNYFKARGRASNIRVGLNDPEGLDEEIFKEFPENKPNATTPIKIDSRTVGGPRPFDFGFARPGNFSGSVFRPTTVKRLFGPTKGVPADLPIVFMDERSRRAVETGFFVPSSTKWPDREGKETYDPILNG